LKFGEIDMPHRSTLVGMLITLLAGTIQPAWPAASPSDKNIINAFTVWTGTGSMQQTAADHVSFQGTIGGHLYIDTDQGPVHAGIVSCPVTLEINVTDKSQQGEGKCTITADDGAQVFGQLKCAGFFLIGCSGDFKLTGGTGRFDGIAGSGPVVIRSNARLLIEKANGTADAKAEGIMFWRRLHYTLVRKTK
jgi:hypothetical protein